MTKDEALELGESIVDLIDELSVELSEQALDRAKDYFASVRGQAAGIMDSIEAWDGEPTDRQVEAAGEHARWRTTLATMICFSDAKEGDVIEDPSELTPTDQTAYYKLLKLRAQLPEHIQDVSSVPGPRRCFCGVVFLSLDVDRLRSCLDCRQRQVTPPREISLKSLGLSSHDLD